MPGSTSVTDAPPRAAIPFLVAMMLASGVANTLLTKYQDQQCVSHCDDPDPRRRQHFEQPVLQTAQMFVGEMGCWLVVAAMTCVSRLSQAGRGGLSSVGGEPPSPFTQSRRLQQPLSAGAVPQNSGFGDNGDNTHVRHNDDDDDDDDNIAPQSSAHSTATTSLLAHHRQLQQQHDSHALGITAALDPKATFLRGWRILLVALPAICDILGTTMMNAGLLFIAASVYQMTRGALVLFVAFFSVVFLARRLLLFQWLALVGVVLGVALVGLAGALTLDHPKSPGQHALMHVAREVMESVLGHRKNPEVSHPGQLSGPLRTLVGVVLVAGAQIFTASQFVLEEWIFERSRLQPLQAVGWEGIFGFIFTCLGMLILHVTIGRTDAGRGGYFDIVSGWHQVTENRAVLLSSIFIMVSIGCFNFFGLSVTRSVSATSRSTIDTCRTLFIWIISLALGWESFKWLQVLGFAILVYFTFIFNGIIEPPIAALREEPVDVLLPADPIEHY